jgi:hypothetical protein
MDVDVFGAVVIAVSVVCVVVSAVFFARSRRLRTLIGREGQWRLDHGEARREAIREAVRRAPEERASGSARPPGNVRRRGSAPR